MSVFTYIFIMYAVGVVVLIATFFAFGRLHKGVTAACVGVFLFATLSLPSLIRDMADADKVIESNGFIYEDGMRGRAFFLLYNGERYLGNEWGMMNIYRYPLIDRQEVIRVKLLPRTQLILSIDRHTDNFDYFTYDMLPRDMLAFNKPKYNGYVNIYSAERGYIWSFWLFMTCCVVILFACFKQMRWNRRQQKDIGG